MVRLRLRLRETSCHGYYYIQTQLMREEHSSSGSRVIFELRSNDRICNEDEVANISLSLERELELESITYHHFYCFLPGTIGTARLRLLYLYSISTNHHIHLE